MEAIKVNEKINLTEILLQPHKHSEKTCFFFADNIISYQKLYQNIIKLSIGLQQKGISAGSSVVISLNDSIESIEIFLSCCAIGAVPLFVNPRLEELSLDHILQISQAVINVKENEGVISFNVISSEPQSFSYQELLQNKFEEDFSFYYQTAHSVCFFQSTSGSTGKPKLVAHTIYGALSSKEQVCQHWLNLGENEVFYSVAKLFFGYGMGNSFLFPLLLGASSVLDKEWPTEKKYMLKN